MQNFGNEPWGELKNLDAHINHKVPLGMHKASMKRKNKQNTKNTRKTPNTNYNKQILAETHDAESNQRAAQRGYWPDPRLERVACPFEEITFHAYVRTASWIIT